MPKLKEKLQTPQLAGHFPPQEGVERLRTLQRFEGELDKLTEDSFEDVHLTIRKGLIIIMVVIILELVVVG